MGNEDIFGIIVEQLPFNGVMLVSFTTFPLLLVLIILLYAPAAFSRRAGASLKWIFGSKYPIGAETEEMRQLRGEKIFFETARLMSGSKGGPAVHYNLARAYSLFNKPEEALFHLQKAMDSNYASIAEVRKEPDFARLPLSREFPLFSEGGIHRKKGPF